MFNESSRGTLARGDRDLRAELLSAAGRLLAEPQQIAVPSLRSIARACDVAPSAVYWHFPSESELRSAVLDAQYADLVSTVERALAECEDHRSALVRGAQAYVGWGSRHPGAYQLLFESSDHLSVERSSNGSAVQQRIVGLVAASRPEAPFASSLLLVAALHGLVSLRLHKPGLGWSTGLDDDAAGLVAALA